MNAPLPNLANVERLPVSMTSRDIFRQLGEILEPSYRGPFCAFGGFVADENYDAFMDALTPVIQAYRDNYEHILRTVESDRG